MHAVLLCLFKILMYAGTFRRLNVQLAARRMIVTRVAWDLQIVAIVHTADQAVVEDALRSSISCKGSCPRNHWQTRKISCL